MLTWAIDLILAALKWPLAALFVVLTPWALVDCWESLSRLIDQGLGPNDFLMGALVYFVAWFFIFRSKWLGSYLSTLEHEVTHAIFALLTLHPIRDIRATGFDGGHVKYSGGMGNWLITASPYFFPTLAFILLPINHLVGPIPLFGFILGVATSYHITSTYLETHTAQTDLKKIGALFAWMFLPTANLLSYLFIFAWSEGGSDAAFDAVAGVFSDVFLD